MGEEKKINDSAVAGCGGGRGAAVAAALGAGAGGRPDEPGALGRSVVD
jgi:hypothetical protein